METKKVIKQINAHGRDDLRPVGITTNHPISPIQNGCMFINQKLMRNRKTNTPLEMFYFSMKFELCMAAFRSDIYSFIYCRGCVKCISHEFPHSSAATAYRAKKKIAHNRSSFAFAQCNFFRILSTERSSERTLETAKQKHIYCACYGYVRACERMYVCSLM